MNDFGSVRAAVAGPDPGEAARALLKLTYDDPDRADVQALLLRLIDDTDDPNLRRLAVTCAGHVARLDREIGDELVAKVESLVSDPVLGGTAQDALSDIKDFLDRW